MALSISQDGVYLNIQNILGTASYNVADSMEKIVTGDRIVSASDDAAGVIISTRLTSQILGNASSIKNVLDAISLVQTADGALSSMQEQVQRLNELMIQAKNGTLTTEQKSMLQVEVDDILKSLDDIANKTMFNGINLLNSTGDPLAPAPPAFGFFSTVKSVATTDTLNNTGDWSHDVSVTQLADTMEVQSKIFTSTTAALGISGTFSINGSNVTVSDTDSLTDVMNKINGTGTGVTASITGGRLVIASDTIGSTGAFTMVDTSTASSNFFSSNVAAVDALMLLANNEWSYDVTVNKLAQALDVASNTYASATTALGISGTFKIDGQNVNVADTDTLTDIADKINATSAKVTANIVSGQLRIISDTTGAASTFNAVDLTNDGNIFNSSNTTVATADTLLNNADWSYVMDVTQVAQTQDVGSNAYANSSAALGLTGTFDLGGASFTVTQTQSLNDIRDMINAAGLGLTASIVSGRLRLVSNTQGSAGAFTGTDTSTASNNYSSSNTGSVTTGTLYDNTNWSHVVDVTQLATTMQVSSNGFDPNTALNMIGSFKIDGTTFNVSQYHTLANIKDMINNANIGVSASIDGSNRLILTSKTEGASGAISSMDLTSTMSIFDSSNTNAATTDTLISNTNWSHNVEVTQLAQYMEVASKSVTDANTALNLSGDFTLNGTTFTITDSMSLTNIKDMINAANIGITASIISGKLDLKSTISGTSGAITGTDNSTDSNSYTSSNGSVATTVSNIYNQDWQHTLEVTQLATYMKIGSDGQTSATNPLNIKGSFKINSATFNVAETDTVNSIRDMINAANIGITASVDGSNGLVLTSNNSGTVGAITVTDLTTTGNTFSSSNTLVVATDTLLTNTNWSHNVEVTKLSQGLQVSGDAVANSTSALSMSGSFKIEGVTFNVTDNMSLTDIKDMINSAGLTVTANIASNKLILTSTINNASGTFIAIDSTTNSNTFESTNTGVATTDTLSSNTEWSHVLDVTQLAQNQIVTGDSQSAATTALGLTGSFKIGTKTFNVTQTQSLNDIRDMINTANIGITATVNASNQLVLTANQTGAANAFTSVDLSSDGNTFSSSNPATATTDTLLLNQNWSHIVDVIKLAQGQEVQGTAQASATNPLGLSGTFMIDSTSFNVTDNMSLTDIVNMVNTANIGVIASISSNKLVLTSATQDATGTFGATDSTINSNVFSSNNPTAATTDTLLSNTDWSHNVNITQLATKQQVTSDSQASATAGLGYNGQFKIKNTTFSVTQNQTLTDIKDMINAANIGVVANIDGSNKLVLTSSATGATSSFTIQDVSTDSTVFESTNSTTATTDTLLLNQTWSHTVDVIKLAQGLEVESDAQSSTTNPLGLSGKFTVAGNTFNVTDNMSLTDIVNMINGTAIGVTASINSGKLVLASNIQNAAGTFSTSDNTANSNVFTSTNTGVATTNTLNSNTDWSHLIDVTQLAQAQQVGSSNLASASNPLNYNGQFKINSTTFNVTQTQNLNDIRDMINAANIGVTASINGSNQLILTSNQTGTAGAFTASDLTINGNTFSSSNTGVATTDTLLSSTTWSHVVNVQQLMETQQVTSDAQASTTNPLNLSGTFVLAGKTFNVTDNMSLTDISNMINGAGAGVTASIVSGKINIISNTQGAAGAFTATDSTANSNVFSSTNPGDVQTVTLVSNTDWSHFVDVFQLAQVQQVSGATNPVGNATSAMNMSGSFKIDGVTFNVTDNMSLQDIVNMINGNGPLDITASIDASNNLVLTSDTTGAASAFNVQDISGDTNVFSSTLPGTVATDTLYSNTDWSHTVDVLALAKGQEVESDTQASATNPLGLSGKFTLAGTTFTVTDNMSLTDISNMINGANIGIISSVVSGKLNLKSDGIGASEAFSMSDLTTNSNVFESTSTGVATTDTLISNTDWTHTIDVTQLAQAMKIQSDTQTSATNPMSISGTFRINGTNFNVLDTDSLTDVMNKINTANIGVTASISSNKLVLTSNNTGVANAINISDITVDGNIFSSSNTAVATTNTLNNNSDFSHTVQVDQLSQGMQVTGNKTFSNINTALGYSGTFTLGGKTFNVTDNMSLQNIVTMINGGGAGVTASIAGGKLVLTSNTIGAASAFTAVDNTSFSATPVNTNPLIATVVNNYQPNVEWSQNINVTQIAQDYINYNTTQTETDFSGNWKTASGSWTGGTTNTSNTNGLNVSYLQTTSNFTQDRIVSSEVTLLADGQAGVMSHYQNMNNNAFAYIDTATNQLVIGKTINGTMTIGASTNVVVDPNQKYTITMESDATGKFVAKLQDSAGTYIAQVTQTGWTDAANIQNFVGVFSNGARATFDNVSMGSRGGAPAHQNAAYSVNGGATQYDYDGLVTLYDSLGNPLADVKINNIGTTTIGNSVTNAMLQELGILNGSGAYTNVTKQAQDASYRVDGVTYTSASNTNVNVVGDASIDLKALGTTVIKNDVTNAVMKKLGMITGGANTYKNVVQTAKDAIYKVDGTTYTSASNNKVLVENSVGTDQALINLVSVGTTTVRNTVDNAILKTIGILNSSNAFKNIKSNAQDAQYKIDGVLYTGITNDDIMLKAADGTNQATVDLKNLGSATVKNDRTNAILKGLGMVDGLNNFLHVQKTAQDAIYYVDGVYNTSATNNNVSLSYGGVELAKINLLTTNDATISNVVDNAILKTLGVLTATGTFKNQLGKAQDAIYKVDGTTYTTNTNDNINISGHAIIDLKGVGTTTVANTATHSILKNIGILNSSNSFANVLANPLDAIYKVDGTTYTSGTNTGVKIMSGAVQQALINLTGVGVTTVSNVVDNAILQTLGILNNTATYKHINKINQDAQYKVDGITKTSTTNNDILLEATDGTDHATIDLKALGTTIVRNTATRAIMKAIGMLDSTGMNFNNVISNALDAQYTVDGTNYTSGSNDNITISGGGVNQAIIDLVGVGMTTVKNVVDNAVLQTLGILNNTGAFANKTKTAQNAQYKVDGVSYTTNTNDNITIGDNAGTNHAVIDLKGVGSTTVKNVATNAILKAIGILNASNTYKNMTQQAKDLEYKLDGVAYTTGSNDNLAIKNGALTQAIVDIMGLGTTTVRNIKDNAILQSLGVLTNTGTYKTVVKQAQDAQYKVDGTTYTTNTNDNINIAGHALIDLKGLGTSVVSNVANTAIMKYLGMLDSTNSLKHVYQTAQDAIYKLDGVTKTSSTNNNVTIKSGVDKGVVNFVGLGTTVLKNEVTNAILKALQIFDSSNNFKNVIKQAQDAQYKVDGISYTSNTNDDITIGDNMGTDHATIDLKGIGTTTVRNVASTAILKALGVLDNSGNYANMIKDALDAKYSVDGVNYTSSTNTNVMLKNGTANQAKINLTGVGSSTVKNTVISSVLKSLGILNNSGTFGNVFGKAQDAVYKIDGVTYTSNSNNVTIKNSSGTDLANVTLKTSGNTIVKNAVTNAILKTLGVLNNAGNYANVIAQAQNAEYVVDGKTYSSSVNNVTMTKSDGTQLAKIKLTGLGVSTVANQVDNEVLKALGVLNGIGTGYNYQTGYAQDTKYSIDGVSYTGTSNNDIDLLGDGTIDLKGLGTTRVYNLNPTPPPPFDPLKEPGNVYIHTGYAYENVKPIQLANVRLERLGLKGLNVNDPNSIQKVLSALDELSKVRGKYGAYMNVLETKRDNLENSNLNLIQARSRIQDVDVAKEVSNMMKNKLTEQFSVEMMQELNKQSERILELINE